MCSEAERLYFQRGRKRYENTPFFEKVIDKVWMPIYKTRRPVTRQLVAEGR